MRTASTDPDPRPRGRLRPRLATASVVAALVALIAQPAGAQEASPSPEEATTPVTFTVGVIGDLNSVNPFKQIDSTESWISGLMYDGLLRYKQEAYEPEGELAKSWEVSDDGLTWTFHMREGIRWSDGVPITAQDFVWTADFILDHPDRASAWIDGYRFVDSITAPDDHTVVWRTTRPTVTPGLPGYNLILPEHVWGELGSADAVLTYKNFPDPVVSGAFKLVSWETGQSWEMRARPDYWQGAPHIDTMIFRVYNSNESLVQALIKGAIDYTTIPTAELYNSIKDRPGIGHAVDAAEGFYQLSFNLADDPSSTANPAVLDPRVRQAVEYAIDRQTVIDRVLRGYATPGSTPIAPVYPYWHWQPPEGVARTYDPERAKEILEGAGYRDTDGDGIREVPGTGEPLHLRLYNAVGDTDGIRSTPFLKGWLRDVGIDVSVRSMTDSQLYNLWYAFDWDLILYSWGTGPDPDFLLSTFRANQCGYWSDTCYHNPEYDKLYKDQQTTVDPAERKKIVDQMQQMLYRDVPEIVLWYPNTFEAWRADRWTGFVPWPEPDGVRFWGNSYSARTVQPSGTGGTLRAEGGPAGWMWAVALSIVTAALLAASARRRRMDTYYA